MSPVNELPVVVVPAAVSATTSSSVAVMTNSVSSSMNEKKGKPKSISTTKQSIDTLTTEQQYDDPGVELDLSESDASADNDVIVGSCIPLDGGNGSRSRYCWQDQ